MLLQKAEPAGARVGGGTSYRKVPALLTFALSTASGETQFHRYISIVYLMVLPSSAHVSERGKQLQLFRLPSTPSCLSHST
jgi:hypothetical protein